MPRLVRGAALTAGILGVTACGLLFEPDDLSRAYGEVDAASDGGDAASPVDATLDGDGGVVGKDFCKRKTGTIFCEDFDDGQPLSNRWEEVVLLDSGTLDIVPGVGIDGTSALRVTIGKVNNPSAFVARTFAYATNKDVRCELEIMVEEPPQTQELQFFNLGRGGSSDYNLYLVSFSEGKDWHAGEYTAQLPDGGRLDRSEKLNRYPTTNRWSHVVFEVKGNAGAVDVDGTRTSLGTIYRLPSPAEDDKPWRMKVGNAFTSTQEGRTTLYDNVVCSPL